MVVEDQRFVVRRPFTRLSGWTDGGTRWFSSDDTSQMAGHRKDSSRSEKSVLKFAHDSCQMDAIQEATVVHIWQVWDTCHRRTIAFLVLTQKAIRSSTCFSRFRIRRPARTIKVLGLSNEVWIVAEEHFGNVSFDIPSFGKPLIEVVQINRADFASRKQSNREWQCAKTFWSIDQRDAVLLNQSR
ncbi:MAG: hypothetical protein CMJ69_12200 [Planctomycetaceae bacterium]|nr:hypothetical protein [Planctomycetaceae bacterium]